MNDWYGIHHWRILWSGYRKLAWVEFEHTTTAKEKGKKKQTKKRTQTKWFKVDMKYDRYNAGIHYLFHNKGNVSG